MTIKELIAFCGNDLLHDETKTDETVDRYVKRLFDVFRDFPKGDVAIDNVRRKIKELLDTHAFKDHTTPTALRAFLRFLTEIFTEDEVGSLTIAKLRGPDEDCEEVSYAKGAPEEDRITGLAAFIHNEYEKVIAFAAELLGKGAAFAGGYGESPFVRIPVVLSDETPVEADPLTAEDCAKIIKRRVDEKGRNLTCDEILEILKERDKEYSVMGRFVDGNEPHIEIYYHNILVSSFEEYFATAAMVLAHEYMHYLHSSLMGKKEFAKKGFDSRILKEGVADFFAVQYLIRYPILTVALPDETIDDPAVKMQIAAERRSFWAANRDGIVPYAYALHFYPEGEGGAEYSVDHEHYCASGVLEKFVAVACSERDAALRRLFSRF